MMDKEFRKMRRKELVELLLEERRENALLRSELKKTYQRLADRKIQLEQAGSIAAAALRLNEVFEAAQAAADQYLENVRRTAEAREPHTESGTARVSEG